MDCDASDHVNEELMSVGSFQNRIALVTGGAGFLGSYLVARLVELGARVTSLGGREDGAMKSDGARYLWGEIQENSFSVIEEAPDMVFHLAGGASVAKSVANPELDHERTVKCSSLLLEKIRKDWPTAKLLYVSSAAVYGNALVKTAAQRNSFVPVSPYGCHKKEVEELLFQYAERHGVQCVIVRPFSVYGPGLRKQLLWDALQKADRDVYEFFGSGDELRDWVYVSDLIECLLLAIERADSAAPLLNAGTCHAVSVREILTQLLALYQPGAEPRFLGAKKEGDPDRLVAADSAESQLGRLFRTSLQDGLQQYVTWYRGLK